MRKQTLLLSVIATLSIPAGAEIRDPTLPGNSASGQPAVTSTIAETPLTVTEIMISDSGRHAIVNGIVVKAGQTLDDSTRIVKIHPRYVLIRRQGVNQKIHLVPSVKNR